MNRTGCAKSPRVKMEQEDFCTIPVQNDPEAPQIKEEEEEVCTSVKEEQLILKQETETFMLTSTCEESDESEDQTLDLSPDESAAENQFKIVIVTVKEEPVLKVKLEPNTELPQQHVWKEEEVLTDQERMSSLDRDDPQIKEEQEEVCTSLKEEQLEQEAETFILTPTKEASDTDDSDNWSPDEPKPQERLNEGKSHSDASKIQLETNTGKMFVCATCEKRFSHQWTLKAHMRVHTGEKPYSCNTCEKRFTQLWTLKVHTRVHTGEKPYQCDTCEKRFSQLQRLKAHMRVHTGEKPYQCDTCEKRFSSLGTLKAHTRTHTGEKPYVCSTCEKRFSQLCALKKHMRVHAEEKP